MAMLRIIDSDKKTFNVKGLLTFRASKYIDEETKEEGILVTGEMKTHRYIESIDRIETHRYILLDVEVVQETFGSDDFDILYEFRAKDYFVKNGETDLSEDLIAKIESRKYNKNFSDAIYWDTNLEGGE